jgi:class 3 adenylate cyclase
MARKVEWSFLAPWTSRLDDDGDMAPVEAALDPPVPGAKPAPLDVVRTFAFVDISGFTQFCDRYGEQRAIELLSEFRETVRTAAARRGVRVAKWLGDGVMLVGIEGAAVAATVGEVLLRCDSKGLHTHAGIAGGAVLLFEGDDYVGRTVNLAARLGDAAALGEILLAGDSDELPDWLVHAAPQAILVPGFDSPVEVRSLAVRDDVRESFLKASAA